MHIHACLLARRTGRPVQMTYGRGESFHGHVHRHPSRTWIRYGATEAGKLVAADVRLLLDGGAYASSSPAVLANAATFAAGPYEIPNVRVEATVVYTNNPPCGAMRGFGAPQVCFAYEAAIDALAARLQLDPVELRRINALRPGSILPTGQARLVEVARALATSPKVLLLDEPASGQSESETRHFAQLLRELAGDVSFALDHLAKTRHLEFLASHDPLTELSQLRQCQPPPKLRLCPPLGACAVKVWRPDHDEPLVVVVPPELPPQARLPPERVVVIAWSHPSA